jgi:hypothetical protein
MVTCVILDEWEAHEELLISCVCCLAGWQRLGVKVNPRTLQMIFRGLNAYYSVIMPSEKVNMSSGS